LKYKKLLGVSIGIKGSHLDFVRGQGMGIAAADRVLVELTSRDVQRIWSASHDVAKSHDQDVLTALAQNIAEIVVATDGIDLGGALRPNRATLDFVIRKLRHFAMSDSCLCTLYPHYDLFNPADEAQAGHVAIISEETIPYASVYTCRCGKCGATYTAEERDYHYMWWQWIATGRV
jgi:hypothetical protein